MGIAEMLLVIGGAVFGAVVILVFVGLELYRRERDDDQYKEVAQEVAMGLRQAFTALNGPGKFSDVAVEIRRNRLTFAILEPLVLKARAITGPTYIQAPGATHEIRPLLDEDVIR